MPYSLRTWKRGVALLLAGGLLAANLSGSFAYAESTPPQEPVPATAETTATPETAAPANLSEQAQAFVDAVNALDRSSMVAASNAWGLAHEAWLADPGNAELETKLNEATTVQEEVCAPLSEAEDLYNQIPETERSDEQVQSAYAVLASILAATYTAMESPTATGPDGTPELDEIRRVMYDDLPDEPTGSYIGSMGLPIATGETRISISEWGPTCTMVWTPTSTPQPSMRTARSSRWSGWRVKITPSCRSWCRSNTRPTAARPRSSCRMG